MRFAILRPLQVIRRSAFGARRVAALAALLLGAGWPVAAAALEASPAMWVVRDADSIVYLLGTIHLVKPETVWRTDKIAEAFDAAEDVWLEASDLSDAAKIQAVVLKHGFDRAHPLSSRLEPEAKARFDELATAAGLNPVLLDPMRPWLAAITISMAPLLKQGYDPAQGVDRSLEADTRSARKTLKSFETAEQQLMIFAGLSPEEEMALLLQSMAEAAMAKDVLDRIEQAWAAGDIETLNAQLFGRMKLTAPALYDAMIVKRNIAWSERLAELMQGAGTSFVAVGAGHLTGDDGVPALLARRGFTVERY